MGLTGLSWADVDPARHTFDRETALAVVRSVVPPVPPRPFYQRRPTFEHVGLHEARDWERAAVEALIGHYGEWACGWTWGRGDAGGAGPLTAWCSVTDSISTPEETLVTVAQALVEWRGGVGERGGGVLPSF